MLQEILQEKEHVVIDTKNLKDNQSEALSGTGKVRSFQRKIYLKSKQESVKVSESVSSIAAELSPI